MVPFFLIVVLLFLLFHMGRWGGYGFFPGAFNPLLMFFFVMLILGVLRRGGRRYPRGSWRNYGPRPPYGPRYRGFQGPGQSQGQGGYQDPKASYGGYNPPQAPGNYNPYAAPPSYPGNAANTPNSGQPTMWVDTGAPTVRVAPNQYPGSDTVRIDGAPGDGNANGNGSGQPTTPLRSAPPIPVQDQAARVKPAEQDPGDAPKPQN